MTQPEYRRPPIADIVFAAVMIAVGVTAFASVSDLKHSALEPIGPSAFPLAVSVVLIALSAFVIVKALRAKRPPAPPADVRRRADLALITLVLTVAYFLAMELDWLSFRWATVTYVALLTATLSDWRIRALPVAVVIGLVAGIGLKFVFTQVLYLDLP